ncbi:RHS repeat-associated core domain-containing protein [Kribbella sp. CA-293567]|uniref:RHS repeat-associated core domain-containing protein n=1 Tax=Kribbella sp. CA-293567 TaxID=3002436 RepID=UPI0022DD4459|nr:RHS repeat-associated core domain-containing protein [Kribbella sp. CA-293567]WBQ02016.1 type IV secretion protein Rhs [Kribbella sp. CA-293567]
MRSSKVRKPAAVLAALTLTATLTTTVAPTVAAATGGPSVPLPNTTSVASTKQSMAPRPADEATTRSLTGNQPASGVPKEGSGTSSATSLSQSATWAVSAQSGDFSWSYPLRVPPAPGGLQPNLALSYSSSAVDGRTSATNNQASWAGDGWSLEPGFIERSYSGCADDKEGSNKGQNTPDLCWRSDNAVAAYGSGGGQLILGANGWRAKQDDGSRVERLHGADNGDADKEYWRITDIGGTQYYFGSRKESKSTWTVPVYGDDTGEPCHGATFEASSCTQAWRWQLDKVIDRLGNVMIYNYAPETGTYGQNLKDAPVSYTRGGHLSSIEYGLNDAVDAPATGRVEFAVADRCVPGSTCTLDKKDNFPDVPLDQQCAANCKDHYAPTFWTTKRLASVTTSVRRATGFAEVDRWTLDHQFPDPGDGEKAALWLKKITHTGLAGPSPITLDPVTFEGSKLANRVYQGGDNLSPLIRYRLTGIVSEAGGVTTVNYAAPDCLSAPTNAETNLKRCFPVRWTKKNYAERTDYFNKYVVASVVQSDRISASPQQQTSYEYLDGAAWHYDDSEFTPADKKTWNDYRGYGRVRIRTGVPNDPSGPVTMSEQRFFRGMHDDHLPTGKRTVNVTDSEGGSHPDHDWLNSAPLETITYLGESDTVVSKSITEPVWQGPTATRGDFKAYLVNQGTATNYTALDNGRGWLKAKVLTKYDDRGLPVQSDEHGDLSRTDDDKCTRTTYARDTDKWILDLASRVETVAVGCSTTPTYPADALSDVVLTHDAAGNLTKSERLDQHPAAGPVYVTDEIRTYDVYGRQLTSTDALGATSTTTYTPATGGAVTQLVAKNAAGHTTTQTLDPAWDRPLTSIDPNQRKSETAYDALGRAVEAWQPNRPRSANPTGSEQISYTIRSNGLSVISSSKIGPNGLYTTSNQLYDGLLRVRQIQSPAPGGGRLLTDTRYDSQGRTHKSTQPYFNDAPVDDQLWTASSDADIPGLTVTQYDGAGRPVEQIYQGGTTEKWRTSTHYGGDRVDITPPAGGTPTTRITDMDGQTTELRQYKAATPTGAYDSTKYTYTRAGRLASVQNPAGSSWEIEYDLAGRQTKVDDPDKGVSTKTYDVDGRLLTESDARGVTVSNSYDILGRKLSTSSGDTLLAKWTYDTASFGKGLPASETRYEGEKAYTSAVTAYNALNQPLQTKFTIPEEEAELAGTYTTTTKYNVDGSQLSTTYPAAGDLPAETLNHTYDDAGRAVRTYGGFDGSTVEYALNTEYTRYGELQRVHLGEGTQRAWLSYYYDDHTRQLNRKIVDAEVTRPMQSDIRYTRDPRGNLTSISDTPQDQTGDVQCFRYDYLRRLTAAWTPDSDCSAEPATAGLAGPAPYWHSFDYDKSGNRVTEIQHAAGGDTVRNYAYPAAAADRPHSLTSVTSGTRVDTYGYDAAGNTTSRKVGTRDDQLAWNPEGRLAEVTDKAGRKTSFVYDNSGNRLIRRDASTVKLTLPGQELKLDRSTGTVKTTRYYMHAGATVAARSATSLTWLADDHQGTAQVSIDAASQAVTKRRQTPFGASRGGPVGWHDEKGFVGGSNDASTALTHIGAREYEPETGRFISVDPIMDVADPQQMQGYAYANNSPITNSDPSGLKFCGSEECTEVASGGHCSCNPPPRPLSVDVQPDIPQKPKAQKPKVQNQRLDRILSHIYPEATDRSWIGSGKQADALRNELLTGRATKGIYHADAVARDLSALVTLLQDDDIQGSQGRPIMTDIDRAHAIAEARELLGGLNQEDRTGMVTRAINEDANKNKGFRDAMSRAKEKAAFRHVSDATFNHGGPKENGVVRQWYPEKGATTRGFIRGMGALGVVPTVIDLAKINLTPGGNQKEKFVGNLCAVGDPVGMMCGPEGMGAAYLRSKEDMTG